jgi:K+ transporter
MKEKTHCAITTIILYYFSLGLTILIEKIVSILWFWLANTLYLILLFLTYCTFLFFLAQIEKILFVSFVVVKKCRLVLFSVQCVYYSNRLAILSNTWKKNSNKKKTSCWINGRNNESDQALRRRKVRSEETRYHWFHWCVYIFRRAQRQ